MVGDWSPDPPREADEQLTNSAHDVFFESEDSEEDTYTSPPVGYELLFASNPGLTSDEEGQSDSSEDNNEGETEQTDHTAPIAGPSASSPTCLTSDVSEHLVQAHRSEVQEVDALYSSNAPRPDINVNCDEVRAAMSGFTLPPSSVPPWAENIPEAQWAATIMQQLQRLLTKDDSKHTT